MNKDDLITENMKLVYYIVSKDYPTFIRDEDIIQSGMLGLCKAAQSWDESKAKFSTYAGKCIRNEINQEFIRRKPHSKNISLEIKIGEEGTLADVLVGEDDVGYVDYDEFYSQLEPLEAKVFDLDTLGYDTDEIANQLGITVTKVQKTLRIIRLKWRRFYGD